MVAILSHKLMRYTAVLTSRSVVAVRVNLPLLAIYNKRYILALELRSQLFRRHREDVLLSVS